MRVDRLSSLGGVALLLVACGEAGVPDASNLTTPSLAPSGHLTPYSGPFVPSAIATDDGRVIIIAGAGRTDDDRAVGVLARSDDGASTFSLWQVEGAEAFDGVAIRGRTIWITADCVSSACLLGSTDDGLTFHDLGTGRSLSPSLSSPTAGIVLSPLVDGEAQALEVDGAGTFTPIDICGADASPVSVSLNADGGVAACRANGDPVLDYDDDWWLVELGPEGWAQLYAPPDGGAYDPGATPSLATSWVNRVARRDETALLSTGAGYYRSADGGRSWARVDSDPVSVPLGAWPDGESIAAGGEVFGYGSFEGGDWWVLRSGTGGATWTIAFNGP